MYNPIPKVPDFPEMERRMLQLWEAIDAFNRLRKRNAGGPKWSFLDGPITANNPMGVHHAWGRSYKDMFQRFHAMNGKDQRYQNGFDCQGLWVEVEVEKSLGFETRRDILEYGIDNFVRDCKERVLTYAARQTEQSRRLGYWTEWDDPETLLALRDALHDGVKEITITAPSGETFTGSPESLVARLGSPDFGGSYFTFSDENNYTIWAFLKKCHDEGFVYRGTDVMPWCTRCGTGLSQMEVTEGRKIVSHTSVFVRFPLLERENEALLVWTTTPWTLTSNVAAAVNPKMTYLKVRHGEWIYYLGKGNFERDRVQELEAGGKRKVEKLQTLKTILKGSGELEVLGEVTGESLVGLRYRGPFDHFESPQRKAGLSPYEAKTGLDRSAVESHAVIPWDEVSESEGTGIVHIAPGCGAEDHALGVIHDLPVVAPLANTGEYLEGFGELTGQHVLGVTDRIVTDLKERGLLVAKEAYPHVYPHCWRCKEELVFRLVDEWFIRMDWRDRIKKVVPDIRWIPAEGEARELDWLNNMGDWMISKKRFWGLSLPIWVCGECDHFTVLGSREELQERAVEGWEAFEGHTPHRPFVDQVKIACEKCGAKATRVEDVGNPWLDAGIVPFSTLQYNTDRDYWNEWFPADFVVESFPGQFRNWFYALLAMSAMMEGKAPFRTLLGYALVRDARGEEMHKSTGNAIAFDDGAEAFGAEVMRYIFAEKNPIQNLNFPDLPKEGETRTTLDVEVRRKLLTFWNVYSFFLTYATVDKWVPSAATIPVAERSELDRWILSRLQRTVEAAHRAFDGFTLYHFIEHLEQFDEELSNWYLRRSRKRFWAEQGDPDKESAYQTLHTVLATTVQLLAPILPFLAEEIYQNLVRSVDPGAPESVHLCPYPVVNATLVDETLERKVACVIRAKNLGLSLRSQANVKTRQPLARLIVRPRDAHDREVLGDRHFVDQVLEECNVKVLELIEDESTMVTTTVKANFKALGPRYGKLMKRIAAALGDLDPVALQKGLAEEGVWRFTVDGEPVELLPGDLDLVHQGPENTAVIVDQGMFVALDTAITPELEAEGIARDFNRAAQDQRKAVGLEVHDRIRVRYSASDRIAAALEEHREFLMGELLALGFERAASTDGATAKVGGEEVGLEVVRA